MKKSLKVIYPLLGLFCITNCSECNNFAIKDQFGGDGDLDYQTYIRDFPQNSKDFESFIKYFGKPCVLKQVYPENLNTEIFGAFSSTILDTNNRYKALLFSKNDSELSDDERKIKDKLTEEHKIFQKYQNLLNQIKNETDSSKKKQLQNEAMKMLKGHGFLEGKEESLSIFQDTIKDPVKLNGVKIKSFYADIKIDNDGNIKSTWTIEAENAGGNIKIHRYYLNGSSSHIDKDNYFTVDFSSNKTQTVDFEQNISFPEGNNIFIDVNLVVFPECFVKCDDFKIQLEIPNEYHITHRFPYLKLIEGNVYSYEKSDNNAIESDLAFCFGISKNDYLKTDIKFHYVADAPIGSMEGAMPIYSGPYLFSPCEINNASGDKAKKNKKDAVVYEQTNLPDNKVSSGNLYDTFDHEFFIKGVKSNKIDISFNGLEMLKDIKDRVYSGLQENHIKFSKTSDQFLRIYAQRILNEIFHVSEKACTCTKVAALCKFVHYWVTYQDHKRAHAMNPIEIFTLRKGICVDYTHLLLGLCSSIGINNIVKISGIGCNNFSTYEKHSWCVCYCPECMHNFEFDPTWNQCFQVGPEHIFLSKTHRVNDTADKMLGGNLHKSIEVSFKNGNTIVVK